MIRVPENYLALIPPPNHGYCIQDTIEKTAREIIFSLHLIMSD